MATIATDAIRTTSAPGKPGRKRNPFNFDGTKQKFREPSIFVDFVASYPNHAATFIKLYRLLPKIDLMLIGETETAIEMTSRPMAMTRGYIADRWGRGRYWLLFNDGNRPQGQQQVAQTWIDVDEPDAKPAVYDINTLELTAKENADEVQRLMAAGKLERDERGNLHIVRAGDRTASAPAPVVPAPVVVAPQMPASSSVGDQIALKLLERAIPSATPLSPEQMLEGAFKIAARLSPPPSAGDSALVAELRNELNALRQQMQSGSQLDRDLAAYERMEQFFNKIGAGRATSSIGSEEPVWVKPLVQLADRFGAMLMMRMNAAPAPAAAPQNTPRPAAAVESPAPAPAAPAASYPQFLPADAPIMDRAVQVVSIALDRYVNGVSGFNFAAWLVKWYPGGREVYKLMEAAGTPADIIGLMAFQPEIQRAAGPLLNQPEHREKLEEWLADFLNYDADSDDSPESEDGAAAA